MFVGILKRRKTEGVSPLSTFPLSAAHQTMMNTFVFLLLAFAVLADGGVDENYVMIRLRSLRVWVHSRHE